MKIREHRRAVVIPDQHYPLHDKKAVSCVHQALRIIEPDIFINLGDVGEWQSVSHWNWRRKKKPPLEWLLPVVDKEIQQVNEGIDQMDQALDQALDRPVDLTTVNRQKSC